MLLCISDPLVIEFGSEDDEQSPRRKRSKPARTRDRWLAIEMDAGQVSVDDDRLLLAMVSTVHVGRSRPQKYPII
jgi:hypothetical protein